MTPPARRFGPRGLKIALATAAAGLVVGAACPAGATTGFGVQPPNAATGQAPNAPDAPGAVAAPPVAADSAAPAPTPHRQLIIRRDTVDVVLDGALVSQVPRPGGVIEAGWLVGKVPARWLSGTSGSTLRLSSEIVLGRGAVFEVGPLTTRLEMMGGSDPRESAGISAGSGTLLLFNTMVVSVDPSTGRLVSAAQLGRPWISVGMGGRVDMRDSHVSGLGTGTGSRSAGLFLGPGASGSVSRSTFEDNKFGLVLSGTQSVTLDKVTARRSALNGVALRDDVGTTIGSVTSTDNAQDGVSISGVEGRRISGLHTERNKRYGVRIADLHNLVVAGTRSVDDSRALVLDGCQLCVVQGLDVHGGEVGLQVGGASGLVRVDGGTIDGAATGARLVNSIGGVTLDRLSVTGASTTGIVLCGLDVKVTGAKVTSKGTGIGVCGQAAGAEVGTSDIRGDQIGIRVIAPARDVTVIDTAVSGGRDAGVAVSASGVSLTRVQVSPAHTGIHIYGEAQDTSLDQVTVRGGRDGIVATGTTKGLTIFNPRVSGVSGDALSSGSDGLSVREGTITDAGTGLSLRGTSEISGLSVVDVVKGLRISKHAQVASEEIDVLATKIGIQVERGGSFVLADSRVRASRALVGHVDQRGTNVVTLPPFPWYGFAAIGAVVFALLLEVIHRVRTGRSRAATAPKHVTNIA